MKRITENYIHRHLQGKKEEPMYSFFPDVQTEEEQAPDTIADLEGVQPRAGMKAPGVE